jgi:hypothetical protein
VYKKLPLVVDTFEKTAVQPIKNWQETAIKLKSLKKGFFQKFEKLHHTKKSLLA